jgi:aldehyde:ferredoxin oxidoreductase
MADISGTSNKVLEVDLSSKEFSIYHVTETERTMYLGGKGLGLKLLYDRMKPGINPLGEDNIIAFMPGVLAGTRAHCGGRLAAVSKSPLTGIMAFSSCGGPFAAQLKTAGWDGLLIKGKATQPTYLEITSTGVAFKDAKHLWGRDTFVTQNKLGGKKAGTLIIGVAGENLVRYANIISGHRFLGRTGMGAIMGSKNLKAIVALGGEYKIIPKNQKLFDKAWKKAKKYLDSNYVTSVAYRKFGTSSGTNLMNRANGLPVNNFKSGNHQLASEVSGERMKEKHNTKYYTCKPCTIYCGKKGDFNGEVRIVPEYETVSLLGTNLGIFDSNQIAEWNHACGELGMDTISVGNTIGWLMEAAEKGLVKSDLKFGSAKGVSDTLKNIASGNGFGKEMGLGVRALSDKYGGKDFAMHVKGLEISGYDSRACFGQGLAYATANRGAHHLSAYVVGLEVILGLLNPYTTRAKAEFTKFFESLTCCINSLHACLFTMYAYPFETPVPKYTPKPILAFAMQNLPNIAIQLIDFSLYAKQWSAMTGEKISNRDFLKAGSRIHVLERYMNTREGISRKDDTLPPRLLNESRPGDPKKRTVPLEKMLDKYYKLRGYDENGIPKEKTLRGLGIV